MKKDLGTAGSDVGAIFDFFHVKSNSEIAIFRRGENRIPDSVRTPRALGFRVLVTLLRCGGVGPGVSSPGRTNTTYT